MITQGLLFLISTIGDLFAGVLLLRFLLQWLRVPAANPLTPLVVALTNFIVRPARRVIPGLWGVDLSTLALGWLAATLTVWLTLTLGNYHTGAHVGEVVIGLGALGALHALRLIITIFIIALVLQAILSWVNPYSPLEPALRTMTQPLLRPLRKRIPPVANVDLTPLIALLLLELILIVPIAWLEAIAGRLLHP